MTQVLLASGYYVRQEVKISKQVGDCDRQEPRHSGAPGTVLAILLPGDRTMREFYILSIC